MFILVATMVRDGSLSELRVGVFCQLCPVLADGSWAEGPKVHYDYYTQELLDEDFYQQGRGDELKAMGEYGVVEEVPIYAATGGKHIGGLPIAHVRGGVVRWRFVATEVNNQVREDNTQGTPPLMI